MPARNRAQERKRAERKGDPLQRHCHRRDPGEQAEHGYYRESSDFAYGCPLCWRARREAEMLRELRGEV